MNPYQYIIALAMLYDGFYNAFFIEFDKKVFIINQGYIERDFFLLETFKE